jgi:dethiobiotin synthase
MSNLFPPAFFVTGTDTNVGKTVVSAILTAGLGAAYWKPVQSGTTEETDSQWIARVLNLPAALVHEEAYRLTQPLSPHASARIDGVYIEMERFRLPRHDGNHLIVEGAGGVMVPLNEQHLVIDLIKQLRLPALVVARSGLGTINHTVLTLQALRRQDIEVLGVVMNGPPNPSNREAIEYYGKAQVLAEIPPLPQPLTAAAIHNAFSYFRESGHADLSNLASIHANENRAGTAAGGTR